MAPLVIFWHLSTDTLDTGLSPITSKHFKIQFSANKLLKSPFWLRKGAQGVTLSICLSVRPAQTCLKVSIFILEQSGSVSSQSQVSLRFLWGLSELTLAVRQSLKYFVLLKQCKCVLLMQYKLNQCVSACV